MIRKQLERDRLTELQVLGAIDLAHAATAGRCDDAKAAGEESAGGEAPQSEPGDESPPATAPAAALAVPLPAASPESRVRSSTRRFHYRGREATKTRRNTKNTARGSCLRVFVVLA